MTNAFLSSGLFGDLLRDATVADMFSGESFLDAMLDVESGWTHALAQVGAIDATAAQAARNAIADWFPDLGRIAKGSARDGVPVPELVRALREGQDDASRAAIHTGLTSQDVVDTAMALTLRGVFDLFCDRMDKLIAALGALRDRHEGARMMGHTRMQAALPIPVAARVDAWRRPLQDHRARMGALRDAVCRVQVGGPVGLRDMADGQGEAAAAALAKALGLAAGPVWHSDRTPMVEAGQWFTLVTGTLGKMGQDVALMAQAGPQVIRLSGGGASSAMPHKHNPVRAEMLVALARFAAAQQGGLAQAMVHEQERSGAGWALEWLILPAMAEVTGAALRSAATLVAQIDRIGGGD